MEPRARTTVRIDARRSPTKSRDEGIYGVVAVFVGVVGVPLEGEVVVGVVEVGAVVVVVFVGAVTVCVFVGAVTVVC